MKKAVILLTMMISILHVSCGRDIRLKNAGKEMGKEMQQIIRKTSPVTITCTVYDDEGYKVVEDKSFDISNQYLIVYDASQLFIDLNEVEYFTHRAENGKVLFYIYLQ